MSIVITNKKNLNGTALFVFLHKTGKKTIEEKGDITVISIGDKTVSVNVRNSEKYFKSTEGVHTISSEQVEFLKKQNINFEIIDFFSVGEVVERETHPKSDKLFVLKVRADKDLQIVTNAANATVGKKVVVARVGAVTATALPISFSKVMGVESEGMLCGGETLGLSPSDGVMIVDGLNGEEFIL